MSLVRLEIKSKPLLRPYPSASEQHGLVPLCLQLYLFIVRDAVWAYENYSQFKTKQIVYKFEDKYIVITITIYESTGLTFANIFP